MENNKKKYQLLFKNQEKRTGLIKEMDEYLNLTIQGIESNYKITGEIEKNSDKYNYYIDNFLQEIQKLNDELKNLGETESDTYKKDIKFLLNLESENYKITLDIFNNKIKCFDMLKNEDDDHKLIKKEKEISLLKETLSSIREQINDFITNLKYKNLY